MAMISVIMGVYNCKKPELLKESVNSIINQTFQDWELLICDDGSTNDTYEKIIQIAKQDSRIKVLHYDQNVCLGNALNECLKHATGIYVARQDDDDYSEPTRLEKELAFLKSNPEYCMVGTTASIYDERGGWGHYRVPEKPQKRDFYKNSPFIHPSLMFRKTALERVGGYRISKETRRCEDYDMFMRMYSMNMKGYNLQEELYRYWFKKNNDIKYRPMKYRIDEAKVRWIGYRAMGVLIGGIPYVIKPIIAGMIPARFFSRIQNKQYY